MSAPCPVCGVLLPDSGLCSRAGDVIEYQCPECCGLTGVPHHLKQPKKCPLYRLGKPCSGKLVRFGRGSKTVVSA